VVYKGEREAFGILVEAYGEDSGERLRRGLAETTCVWGRPASYPLSYTNRELGPCEDILVRSSDKY
jgi:hypothetical protein